MRLGTYQKTLRCIDGIREKTHTALLFCSFGKDSLVLLDLLSSKFDKVICVFMYFVKGLEHIDKYMRWAKAKYDNVEIEQIPHFMLSSLLRSGLFCVANPHVKILNLKDMDKAMKIKHSANYSFFGMKKADCLNRHIMLDQYGDTYEHMGKVYPLADWLQKDVLRYLKMRQIPEPVRYSKQTGGGVGFELECFLYLREHYPDDLQKILKAFPASEKLLIDHDNKQNVRTEQVL